MIRMILLFFALSIIFHTRAQDTTKAKAPSGNIIINDYANIAYTIERHKLINERSIYINGFRIQIAFTNNKEEAMQIKTKFYKLFPEIRCYTTYEQPYHKIRIGDYQNMAEAQQEMKLLIKDFPSSFLVPDKVRRKKITID
jgi:hypothetical protein